MWARSRRCSACGSRVSGVKIGNAIDAAYTDDDVGDFSTPINGAPLLQSKRCVGADKGYSDVGHGKRFAVVVTASGEKEQKKHGKKKGDVHFHSQIASGRSVVERVFAHLKARHGILRRYDWPTSIVDGVFLDQLILFACILFNRKLKKGDLMI